LLDFEVVGPIARTTRDIVLMMEAIATPHPRDPASGEFTTRTWSLPPARQCRILYVPRFGGNPVDPQIDASVAKAAKVFAGLGHAVTEAAVPFAADAFNAVWPVISQAGLAALLRPMPGWREQVAPAFVEMAEAGLRLCAADLVDALAEIVRMRECLGDTFAHYDVLLTPAAAALPWPAQEAFPRTIAGREVGPRGHAIYAAFVNASGCPAISVPCTPAVDGLPIGFQLVGAPGQDERVCLLAQQYEAAEPWAHRWPLP
jgi:aspartyl-tRNA(Asn)/glutamyl-tRNA(Gln) amidotransferase subunit A